MGADRVVLATAQTEATTTSHVAATENPIATTATNLVVGTTPSRGVTGAAVGRETGHTLHGRTMTIGGGAVTDTTARAANISKAFR